MSEEIERLKEEEKEAMNEKPVSSSERRPEHHQGNLTGGLILIGIGVIFLIVNTTNIRLDNWWALFIFIPAVANLGNAWRQYQADGRLSRRVRGSLTGGLLISAVAIIFLLSLDWGLVWPIFLIILGLNALLNGWSD